MLQRWGCEAGWLLIRATRDSVDAERFLPAGEALRAAWILARTYVLLADRGAEGLEAVVAQVSPRYGVRTFIADLETEASGPRPGE